VISLPGYKRLIPKPPVGTLLDVGNPLVAGLAFAATLAEGMGPTQDIVTKTTATGGTWSSGSRGRSILLNGTNEQISFGHRADWNPPTGDFAFFVVANPTTAQAGGLISKRQNSGSFPQVHMAANVNAGGGFTANSWAAFSRDGTNSRHGATTGGIDGNYHAFAMSLRAGVMSLYLDGISKTVATSNSGSIPLYTGTDPLIVGSSNTGTWLLGNVVCAYYWTRALSDAEHAGLAANPFAFLQVPSTRRFFSLGGATVPLAAALASVSSLTPTLQGTADLAASLASVSTTTATLRGTAGLSASLAATSTLTATLRGSAALSSSLTATATLSVASSSTVALAAALASSSSVAATLRSDLFLAASLASTSTLTSTLRGSLGLAASLAAFSSVSANLSTSGVDDDRVPFEQALAAYLADDNAIAALAGGRIFLGRIPQSARKATPTLTFRVISRRPEQTLDGESGLIRTRVQIDATGKDAIEAEALAFAARSAVGRIAGRQEIAGVTFAAAWVDDAGGIDDDTLQSGTDSMRSRQRIDCFLSYYESTS
jgi:hypothetical protein